MNEYVLYVIVKTLPSMNAGKAEAHSGHAASKFMWDSIQNQKQLDMMMNWAGKLGFGTQINLSDIVDGKQISLELIWNRAIDFNVISGLIIDPTYPYRVPDREIAGLINAGSGNELPEPNGDGSYTLYRQETTAVYLFGKKDDPTLMEILKGFKVKK